MTDSARPASTLTRIIRNTGANYLFGFFDKGLELVSIPVLVFALGEEEYGIILLAQTILLYFKLLESGVPQGVVKYVAEFNARDDRDTVNSVINTSLALYGILGVLSAAAVYGFIRVDGLKLFNISVANVSSAENVLLIGGAFALVNWPLQVFNETLKGLEEFTVNNLYRAIGSGFGQGAAMGAALLGWGIEAVFALINMRVLVQAVFQHRRVRRLLPYVEIRVRGIRYSTARMIIGYSFWMLVTRASSLLIYETDRIIVGLFLPVSALTVYHVISRPLEIIKKLANTFGSALTPAVSNAMARRGRKAVEVFIYTASKYYNAFLAPLAVIGAFLCGPFIRVWMGEGFMEYVWIAQIACAFKLIQHSNAVLGRTFYGTGRVRELGMIGAVVAVINIPLGVWWVQEIQVAGVIAATVAVFVLAQVLQYIYAMPQLDIDRWRYFVTAVVKGQWTSWVMAIGLLPLWAYFQSIGSWIGLAAHAAAMGVLLYGAAWFLTVEDRHRKMLVRAVAR